VLGETEIRYLHSLDDATAARDLDGVPAAADAGAVRDEGLEVPPVLLELAAQHGIPVLRSTLKTSDFYRRLQPYLEERFAPP
jgi:HPr kinase/phosphorylase